MTAQGLFASAVHPSTHHTHFGIHPSILPPTQPHTTNQVGVLTMAGRGVELLVSPTDDVGKLLSCLHGVKVGLFI